MPERGLDRRHMLGATAAFAAFATLPLHEPASRFDSAAAERVGAEAATLARSRVAGGSRAGATVSPSAMATQTWPEAARRFDHKVGRPMAVNAARMYFTGATLDSGPGIGMVRKLAHAKVSAVLSFAPSKSLHASEITRLRKSIHQCLAAGLHIEAVAIYHEPNDITKHPHPFRSAHEYVRYVHYYAPAVRALGVPLAYIPLVLTNEGHDVIRYFPGATLHGKPLVTKIFADFYCHAQYVHGVRLGAVLHLASLHKLQLGLGEFGMTDGRKRPSEREFRHYMEYLTRVFSQHPRPASCMYFANGQANVPTAAGYTSLRRFYDALHKSG